MHWPRQGENISVETKSVPLDAGIPLQHILHKIKKSHKLCGDNPLSQMDARKTLRVGMQVLYMQAPQLHGQMVETNNKTQLGRLDILLAS